MKTKNILLIGFMGVGKGRLAREMAARTGFFILDTEKVSRTFATLNKKLQIGWSFMFRILLFPRAAVFLLLRI